MQIRLDRCLADAGYGSRKAVKELLRKRQVTLNESVVLQSDIKVDPDTDVIAVQGHRIGYEAVSYYMMNKPQGVVSATQDDRERTVIDLITEYRRRDLFPVGRLDKDTEGLLLITNDGALANRLLAPGHHVPKTYYAEIRGCVTEREIERFRDGLDIGDAIPTAPAALRVLSAEEKLSRVEITITEGRYHQIKRMFEAVSMQVVYLKRLSMGPLSLDMALAPGDYRRLSAQEIESLLTFHVEKV